MVPGGGWRLGSGTVAGGGGDRDDLAASVDHVGAPAPGPCRRAAASAPTPPRPTSTSTADADPDAPVRRANSSSLISCPIPRGSPGAPAGVRVAAQRGVGGVGGHRLGHGHGRGQPGHRAPGRPGRRTDRHPPVGLGPMHAPAQPPNGLPAPRPPVRPRDQPAHWSPPPLQRGDEVDPLGVGHVDGHRGEDLLPSSHVIRIGAGRPSWRSLPAMRPGSPAGRRHVCDSHALGPPVRTLVRI